MRLLLGRSSSSSFSLWTERRRFCTLARLLLLVVLLALPATDAIGGGGNGRRRHRGRRYDLVMFIRNNNVTDAQFFRLVGVDNTSDFEIPINSTHRQRFNVRRKGFWTLFVEFPGDRYARSPRKIISRDSHRKWLLDVYYYPGAVGFSEWQKVYN